MLYLMVSETYRSICSSLDWGGGGSNQTKVQNMHTSSLPPPPSPLPSVPQPSTASHWSSFPPIWTVLSSSRNPGIQMLALPVSLSTSQTHCQRLAGHAWSRRQASETFAASCGKILHSWNLSHWNANSQLLLRGHYQLLWIYCATVIIFANPKVI